MDQLRCVSGPPLVISTVENVSMKSRRRSDGVLNRPREAMRVAEQQELRRASRRGRSFVKPSSVASHHLPPSGSSPTKKICCTVSKRTSLDEGVSRVLRGAARFLRCEAGVGVDLGRLGNDCGQENPGVGSHRSANRKSLAVGCVFKLESGWVGGWRERGGGAAMELRWTGQSAEAYQQPYPTTMPSGHRHSL
jgi:hypothetical protein